MNIAYFQPVSSHISEMARDRLVTTVDYSKVVCPLSNHVVINDLG